MTTLPILVVMIPQNSKRETPLLNTKSVHLYLLLESSFGFIIFYTDRIFPNSLHYHSRLSISLYGSEASGVTEFHRAIKRIVFRGTDC